MPRWLMEYVLERRNTGPGRRTEVKPKAVVMKVSEAGPSDPHKSSLEPYHRTCPIPRHGALNSEDRCFSIPLPHREPSISRLACYLPPTGEPGNPHPNSSSISSQQSPDWGFPVFSLAFQ